jgi:hypothetical protein
MNQPLVFFDFCSYCAIASGLGSALRVMFGENHSWEWQIPILVGVGLWVGVRLGMLIFRKKMNMSV